MHNIMRRALPLMIVLAVVVYGGYRLLTNQASAQAGALAGSGSIEATEITVAAESTGRIRTVLVNEGMQ